MNTEVQTIPGEFKLAADWPKLTYPALNDNLVIDWVADDLPLGTFAGPWNSRVTPNHVLNNLPLTTGEEGSTPGVVEQDPNGHKYIAMRAGQRLRNSTINWAPSQDITILAVYRPKKAPEGVATNSRIISGGNGGFRSILHTGSWYSIGVTGKTLGISNMAKYENVEAIIGRYGRDQINGKQYGNTLESDVINPQPNPQEYLVVGGNDTGQAVNKLHGDLFRIRIWSRLLTDQEIEAAMQEQAKLYGF